MKSPSTRKRQGPELTHFMNVDLDIEGRAADVADLLAVLDDRLFVLHRDAARGRADAHYEARGQSRTVDEAMAELLAVLERLPPRARRGWRAARVRDFNVGIQAGRLPHSAEYPIAAATVARVAALGGRIVLTIYAPFPRPRTR